MIDPLTALGAIKTGIAAGKQLHSMSKEIAGFFDSVDGAKKAHSKKKDSIFASANEEALATWTAARNAKTAEAELREFIVNKIGFSAYQDLLKLRREIAQRRKEEERKAQKEAEERQEQILTALAISFAVLVVLGGIGAALYFKGVI